MMKVLDAVRFQKENVLEMNKSELEDFFSYISEYEWSLNSLLQAVHYTQGVYSVRSKEGKLLGLAQVSNDEWIWEEEYITEQHKLEAQVKEGETILNIVYLHLLPREMYKGYGCKFVDYLTEIAEESKIVAFSSGNAFGFWKKIGFNSILGEDTEGPAWLYKSK